MSSIKKRFDIVTIFPEAFSGICAHSILKRALIGGEIEVVIHDIRQYSRSSHRTVDDAPYGGGAGMVMKAPPILDTFKDIENFGRKKINLFLTPQGEKLSQKVVRELVEFDQIVMLCGHYEGVDQRVRDKVIDREISVGDYVLTGGEIPAMLLTDSIARLVDGVLGNSRSHMDESFEDSLLEYPQYTRPVEYEGLKVPEVLLNGHHEKIKKWREQESYRKTKKVRPDLVKY